MKKLLILTIFLLVLPIVSADKLEIDDLDIFVNNMKIATNENRNDQINLFQGDRMTVMMQLQNNFKDTTTKIKNIELTIRIYMQNGKSIFFEELERFNIPADDDRTRTVVLTIPEKALPGLYNLEINAEGKDSLGNMQEDIIVRNMNIKSTSTTRTFIPIEVKKQTSTNVIPDFRVNPTYNKKTTTKSNNSYLGLALIIIALTILIILALIFFIPKATQKPRKEKFKGMLFDDLDF